MPKHQGDPRWIDVKYPKVCAKSGCNKTIKVGERAFYYPNSKSLFCETHGQEAEADFITYAKDPCGNDIG